MGVSVTEFIRVVKIDWDNSENRDGSIEYDEGIFVGNAKVTAHRAVWDWFETLPPTKLYLGWNGEVYPKYRLDRGHLKEPSEIQKGVERG